MNCSKFKQTLLVFASGYSSKIGTGTIKVNRRPVRPTPRRPIPRRPVQKRPIKRQPIKRRPNRRRPLQRRPNRKRPITGKLIQRRPNVRILWRPTNKITRRLSRRPFRLSTSQRKFPLTKCVKKYQRYWCLVLSQTIEY